MADEHHRLTDCLGAGSAGRDDRAVVAAESHLQRHLRAGHVPQRLWEIQGVELHPALFHQDLCAFLDLRVAAAAVADEHANAVAVYGVGVEFRIGDRLLGRGDHELAEAAHAPRLLAVDEFAGFPILHFAGDFAGEVVGGTQGDGADARRPGNEIVPVGLDVFPGRSDRAEARHNNTRAFGEVHFAPSFAR